MDWVDTIVSKPAEEREDDMSNLVTEFAARMRKLAGSAQGETTTAAKYHAKSTRNDLVQMKRFRRVRQ